MGYTYQRCFRAIRVGRYKEIMKNRLCHYLILTIGIYLLSFTDSAVGAFPASENVEVKLLSEVNSIQPGKPFSVGVHFLMNEGWHIYWRNAGDSGIPTDVEWKLPEDFGVSELTWPLPEKFEVPPPLITFGYEDEVLLLAQITPPTTIAAGENVLLQATARWLECEKICIAGEQTIELNLPVREEVPQMNQENKASIQFSRKRLPILSTEWRVSAKAKGKKILLHLKQPAWFTEKPKGLEFYPYDPAMVEHDGIHLVRKGKDGFELELLKSKAADKNLKRIAGTLISASSWVKEEDRKALEIDVLLSEQSRNLFSQWLSE